MQVRLPAIDLPNRQTIEVSVAACAADKEAGAAEAFQVAYEHRSGRACSEKAGFQLQRNRSAYQSQLGPQTESRPQGRQQPLSPGLSHPLYLPFCSLLAVLSVPPEPAAPAR